MGPDHFYLNAFLLLVIVLALCFAWIARNSPESRKVGMIAVCIIAAVVATYFLVDWEDKNDPVIKAYYEAKLKR